MTSDLFVVLLFVWQAHSLILLQQAEVALLLLDEVARHSDDTATLTALVFGNDLLPANQTADEVVTARDGSRVHVAISLSELLHSLCANVARNPHGVLVRLQLDCGALSTLMLSSFDALRREPSAERRATLLRAVDALRESLADFLGTHKRVCRGAPRRHAEPLPLLSWAAFRRLMVGGECLDLRPRGVSWRANATLQVDQPLILLYFGGDNSCAFSRRWAPAVRRAASMFPTVHFFELRSAAAYWTFDSALLSLIAPSSADDDMVRVLKHFASTPAVVLLECAGDDGVTRLVSSARRSDYTTTLFVRWLSLNTGLPAVASGRRAPRTEWAEARFVPALPSERLQFWAALAVLAAAGWITSRNSE
jgi:hypothetical protein